MEMLAAKPFDLVLMDVQMPVMDGMEATRGWRAHELAAGLARIPIIAMTANAMSEDRELCLSSGMDDHIAKPIEMDKLANVLDHWLPKSLSGR
jgi:CheY-like chemotaxis protein